MGPVVTSPKKLDPGKLASGSGRDRPVTNLLGQPARFEEGGGSFLIGASGSVYQGAAQGQQGAGKETSITQAPGSLDCLAKSGEAGLEGSGRHRRLAGFDSGENCGCHLPSTFTTEVAVAAIRRTAVGSIPSSRRNNAVANST